MKPKIKYETIKKNKTLSDSLNEKEETKNGRNKK